MIIRWRWRWWLSRWFRRWSPLGAAESRRTNRISRWVSVHSVIRTCARVRRRWILVSAVSSGGIVPTGTGATARVSFAYTIIPILTIAAFSALLRIPLTVTVLTITHTVPIPITITIAVAPVSISISVSRSITFPMPVTIALPVTITVTVAVAVSVAFSFTITITITISFTIPVTVTLSVSFPFPVMMMMRKMLTILLVQILGVATPSVRVLPFIVVTAAATLLLAVVARVLAVASTARQLTRIPQIRIIAERNRTRLLLPWFRFGRRWLWTPVSDRRNGAFRRGCCCCCCCRHRRRCRWCWFLF
uniref:Putative vegetative cell wall protein gp1 n=1 Tax=Anopheles marajoara TaxID=58244 RepID=A0A2M4BVA2_9DIPT